MHLAITTITCTMLANGRQFPEWLVNQVWPPSFRLPHMSMWSDVPGDRIAIWLGQSLLVWALVVILPTAIASALSMGIPGRHRAAKLGGVKWSLYLTSFDLVVVAVWFGYFGLHPPEAQAPYPLKFTYTLPSPEVPAMLLAGVYGAWWAVGMAASPYNRVRGVRAFVGFALLYVAAWAIMTRVLFPVGALEALL